MKNNDLTFLVSKSLHIKIFTLRAGKRKKFNLQLVVCQTSLLFDSLIPQSNVVIAETQRGNLTDPLLHKI